jgi:hypothetical protein
LPRLKAQQNLSEGWLWVRCGQGLSVNTGVWEAAQALSHLQTAKTLVVEQWHTNAIFNTSHFYQVDISDFI